MQFREQFLLGGRCFAGLLTVPVVNRAQNQSGYGGYSDEKLQRAASCRGLCFYERSISLCRAPNWI